MTGTRLALRALLATTAALGLAVTAYAQAPVDQDHFVIGFWGDPPVDNLINARYDEVAKAHFNVVMGGMGADTPGKAQTQRDACKKYGLMVLFSTYGLPIDQLCNCPTTYGFLVRDHPAVNDFPAVRKRIEEVRRDRPTKLPFVNLYPANTPSGTLGAPDYTTYLDDFVKETDPNMLCSDLMPTFPPHTDEREAYCRNLDALRTEALGHNIPFWNFVKALPYRTEADPTEAEIRWQVYASVTYGARGILYMGYWTPTDDPLVKGNAMIAPDGKRTAHYAQARRINAELKNLGPDLMELHSLAVGRFHAGDQQSELTSAVRLQPGPDGAQPDFLIGTFSEPAGAEAVILTNYRCDDAVVQPTVTFPVPADQVQEVSKVTGKHVAVTDADPNTPGLQLTFKGGEGRLFIYKSNPAHS